LNTVLSKTRYRGPGAKRFAEILETPRQWRDRVLRVGPQALWHATFQIGPAIAEALQTLGAIPLSGVLCCDFASFSEGGQTRYATTWKGTMTSEDWGQISRQVRALYCLQVLLEWIEANDFREFRLQPKIGKAAIHREIIQKFEVAFIIPSETSRRDGNSKGGKNRSKPEWHARAIDIGTSMMKRGKSQRDLTQAVMRELAKAHQQSCSDDQVRKVLQKAGLLTARKKKTA